MDWRTRRREWECEVIGEATVNCEFSSNEAWVNNGGASIAPCPHCLFTKDPD